MNKALVTYALLYANGPLHLGHMAGAIQSDIWVRQQRLLGREVHFVSGDDSHGTPIMLRAEKEGITPEALIDQMHAAHQQDLAQFNICFDHYHTTHSTENQTLVNQLYAALDANGDIEQRTINQLFDTEKQLFLPDRYVKGRCPKCGADDQYGDNCEQCGATYSPAELINPTSTISSTTPVLKETEHYFFKLSQHANFLKQWIHEGHLQQEVANKLDEWFDSGLQDWDISRDAPYFGFEIPGTTDKFFYVWLDAPVGYLASFMAYCQQHPELSFEEFIDPSSDTELLHFIGKDIIYFHALFWPAMLKGANLKTPTAIHVHSFLTIDGKKMSKSRGTFIKAATYATHLNTDCLRYYFAAKQSGSIEDIDLNFEDFLLKVNADLIGKYVNIASRTAGFISKHFNGTLAETLIDTTLYQRFIDQGDAIAQDFYARNTNQALRKIMALADLANQYIAEAAPWQLIKVDGEQNQVHGICSLALNLFRVLTIYLAPVIPATAQAVNAFFQEDAPQWADRTTPLLGHPINRFKPLLRRIEQADIEALISATQQDATQQ